jgi:hypothetical protein
MSNPVEVSVGIKEGITAGTALAAFFGGLFYGNKRQKEKAHSLRQDVLAIAGKVAKLEIQAEKDREFKRMQVRSQMAQMDAFEAIIKRQNQSCEDCPVSKDHEDNRFVQEAETSIRESKTAMNEYLKGLV